MNQRFWIAAIVGCTLCASSAYGFVDDFNDDVVDDALWDIALKGSGPTIEEVNQRLQIRLPGSSHDAGDGVFAAGYRSKCLLQGDFDIQVDYELLDWPFSNGVRVGLGYGGIGVVTRSSLGTAADYGGLPRDVATLDVMGPAVFVVAVSMTGSLRLTRFGNVWTGFYREGDQWTQIGSSSGLASDIRVDIAAWSHDYAFTDHDVLIALDNFRINSGAGCDAPVNASPSTWGRLKSAYK